MNRHTSSYSGRWIAVLALGAAVLTYITLTSLQEIANYQSGRSLFDLAVYEQGFWNALGNPPFFYSLEGSMSRFGRHFSPVFYLILPFYLLHSSPVTLLVVQSAAIGLGAIPLYFLAKRRLGIPFGLLIAAAYLLNPAVHDVNLKNDFHEIAFAMPALLLVLLLAGGSSTGWYVASLLLALSTREEVSLTLALFGVYLIAVGRDIRRGVLTVGLSLTWCLVVFGWVMPAFNVSKVFPMAEGYSYLGNSIPSVVIGAVRDPSLILTEMTRPAKLAYLFWLAEPLAFFCVLAPDVLAVSAAALTIVLASTYPYTFEIFERYAAPIVPFVFLAGIVGVERLCRLAPRWKIERVATALGVVILGATAVSQIVLHKLPSDLRPNPDARARSVFAIASLLPETASVSAADHRWLAHLADRRELYALSASSPETDFILFDQGRTPITNVAPAALHQAEARVLDNPTYQVLRCEDGLFLLGKRQNAAWNQRFLGAPVGSPTVGVHFGPAIRLTNVRFPGELQPGTTALVNLSWQATGKVGHDYHVFVHLVDRGGRLVAQHDGPPGAGYCLTRYWSNGLVVNDEHAFEIPKTLAAGPYELDVGLYDFRTGQRLPAAAPDGRALGDHVSFRVLVR